MTYYTVRTPNGLIEMRQTRFKERFDAGVDHPHDVCAIGRGNDEIRHMIETYSLGDCDFSRTEPETPATNNEGA